MADEKPKEPGAVEGNKLALIDFEGRETGITIQLAAPKTTGEGAEYGDVVASAITGWTTMVVDGTEVPYSPENARTLVARFPWIAHAIAERYKVKA